MDDQRNPMVEAMILSVIYITEMPPSYMEKYTGL